MSKEADKKTLELILEGAKEHFLKHCNIESDIASVEYRFALFKVGYKAGTEAAFSNLIEMIPKADYDAAVNEIGRLQKALDSAEDYIKNINHI